MSREDFKPEKNFDANKLDTKQLKRDLTSNVVDISSTLACYAARAYLDVMINEYIDSNKSGGTTTGSNNNADGTAKFSVTDTGIVADIKGLAGLNGTGDGTVLKFVLDIAMIGGGLVVQQKAIRPVVEAIGEGMVKAGAIHLINHTFNAINGKKVIGLEIAGKSLGNAEDSLGYSAQKRILPDYRQTQTANSGRAMRTPRVPQASFNSPAYSAPEVEEHYSDPDGI